jgi:D-aspartate ligase
MAAEPFGALDVSAPILIFGLSRGTYHHGALGIARSAGRLGIPVHRLALERHAPARCSRYSRGWRTLPPDCDDAQILAVLREQAGEIGRAVLIPVDDASSVFVDRHASELEAHFLFPRQPAGLASTLSNKRTMYELCLERGVDTPWSGFPDSEEQLTDMCADLDFPLVAKCINAGDAPPSAPRVVIAQDTGELLRAFRAMRAETSANVMIQEYIPGTPESVWMFNGYFDEASDCRIAFTGRKIRQSPPYTGFTTLGVCTASPLVADTTVGLMKALGYRGILDIGYRHDARDGRYKLLDVNPRIGGTFRLFVATNGMDVLRALYLDLTGQPIPPSSPQEGRKWVVDPRDAASALAYRRRGDITLRSWLASFRGVREAAWPARDDPLPFLALWAALLFAWLPTRLARMLGRDRAQPHGLG